MILLRRHGLFVLALTLALLVLRLPIVLQHTSVLFDIMIIALVVYSLAMLIYDMLRHERSELAKHQRDIETQRTLLAEQDRITAELRTTNQALQQAAFENERMASELRDSQAQLWFALEAAQMGIWTWDAHTHTITLSGQAASLVGLPPEQHLTTFEKYFELIYPEDQPLLTQFIDDIRHFKRDDIPLEYRVCVHGNIRWLEAKGKIQRAENGQIECVRGTVAEITDRKVNEQALRNSQNRLLREAHLHQQTQKAAKVGGWEVDFKTNMVYWTDELYQIHEVDPTSFSPSYESTFAFYDQENKQRILEAADNLRHHGIPYDLQLTLTTAKGNKRHVHSIAYFARNGDEVTNMYGALQDITDFHNARSELEIHAARTHLLHQIDRAILSADSSQTIANAVLQELRRLTGLPCGCVLEFDARTEEWILIASTTKHDAIWPHNERRKTQKTSFFTRLQRGEQVIIEDVGALDTLPPFFHTFVDHGIRSWLLTPLYHKHTMIGVMLFFAREPGSFTESQQILARDIADLLSIAIQQARLHNQTSEALIREQRLNTLIHTISSSLELDVAVPNILTLTAELFNAAGGVLALISPDGEQLQPPFFTGDVLLQPWRSIPRGNGLLWSAIEAMAPRIIDDYLVDPHANTSRVNKQVQAVMLMPLIAGNKAVGSLALFRYRSSPRFTNRELSLFESVGRQVGIMIQNAQLYSAAQGRAALLSTLYHIGISMSSQLDYDTLMQNILERALRLMGCDIGGIYMFSPDRELLELAAVQPNKYRKQNVLHRGEGVIGIVAETGRPLLNNDYQSWIQRPKVIDGDQIGSIIGVPLIWDGQVVGVLSMISNETGAFRDADIETLRLFGGIAVVAILNAQLFQAIRRQLSHLQTLHEMAITSTEATTEDELIERFTQIASASLYQDSVGVLLLDEATNVLRVHPSHRAVSPAMKHVTVPLGHAVAGTVALTGQPWRISDVREEPKYFAANNSMLSELCVPLKVGERIIGVCNVESMQIDAFTIEDENLLITIAGHLATAIERIRAMRQIQSLNSALEQRVEDRTAQLNASLQELESFSYSVSHDLRAPLRNIDGFSQALIEDYHDVLDEQGRDYLQTVREECQQMGQLIDDMLGLARVARVELHREQVNISEIAISVINNLQRQQPNRHVDVEIEDDLIVNADHNLLRISLTNLLENAWKFTSRQSNPRIEVFSEPQPDGNIAIVVRDNGAGFDMAYASKLFGAFQRLHRQTEFPGTGIGLATVKRIVARHGGRLWATSSPGEGATFRFVLPGGVVPYNRNNR